MVFVVSAVDSALCDVRLVCPLECACLQEPKGLWLLPRIILILPINCIDNKIICSVKFMLFHIFIFIYYLLYIFYGRIEYFNRIYYFINMSIYYSLIPYNIFYDII